MSPDQLLILLPAFFLLAALYTSVGHAGTSGYLAAMALLAIAPETMRPTALALNILVATFTTWRSGRQVMSHGGPCGPSCSVRCLSPPWGAPCA